MIRSTVLVAVVALLPVRALAAREPAAAGELRRIAAGRRPCRELTLRYHDGHARFGFTEVSIERGVVDVVRSQPGGPSHRWTAPLSEAMCLRLVGNATQARLWRVRQRQRAGRPGESAPEIRMGVSAGPSFTVRTWNDDVQDQRAFAIARGQLVVLIRQVSGGQATY